MRPSWNYFSLSQTVTEEGKATSLWARLQMTTEKATVSFPQFKNPQTQGAGPPYRLSISNGQCFFYTRNIHQWIKVKKQPGEGQGLMLDSGWDSAGATIPRHASPLGLPPASRPPSGGPQHPGTRSREMVDILIARTPCSLQVLVLRQQHTVGEEEAAPPMRGASGWLGCWTKEVLVPAS